MASGSHATLRTCSKRVLGDRWRDNCSVADGAGNVLAASRALAVSRGWLEGEPFWKKFWTKAASPRPSPRPMTWRGSRARARRVASTTMRWNSQIAAAKGVVDASAAVVAMAKRPPAQQPAGLDSVVFHLTHALPGQQRVGLDVLHDVVLGTSSGVIPRLLEADRQLEAPFGRSLR